MMDYFQHYKYRLLPVAGGLLDQSNKYVKSMGVIGAAVNVAQKEAQKNG